jgi:hypothetical protein
MSPFLDNIYKKLNKKLLTVVAIVLCLGFAADFVYSLKVPNKGKGITDYSVSVVRQDKTETVEIIE